MNISLINKLSLYICLTISDVFISLCISAVINSVAIARIKYTTIKPFAEPIIRPPNLFIGDNGIGMSKKIDLYKTNSLGLQLITTLVDQIEGVLEYNTIKGTQYKIKF